MFYIPLEHVVTSHNAFSVAASEALRNQPPERLHPGSYSALPHTHNPRRVSGRDSMVRVTLHARSCCLLVALLLLLLLLVDDGAGQIPRRRPRNDRCPKVRAMRNFGLNAMMGSWYVIQYFASTEMFPEYGCMRSSFVTSDGYVTMNFTYVFLDDPLATFQQGNITWIIPNYGQPAHWVHAESSYEEIYNTYVIDTDYRSWALIMHCAEKTKSQKYLSALMLAREPTLGQNVINFLREKLPRYDIDVENMFPIPQTNCTRMDPNAYYSYQTAP